MDYNRVFVSKVRRLIVVFTLFSAFLGFGATAFAQTDSVAHHVQEATASAAHGEEHKQEEKAFDITSFIFFYVKLLNKHLNGNPEKVLIFFLL